VVISNIPWLVPVTLVAIAVAFLVGERLARWLGTTRRVATTLVACWGLIVAATLTPTRSLLEFGIQGSGTCDFSRVRLPTLREWLTLADPSLNVVLFIPLGVAISCLPWSRRTAVVAVAALLSPIAIELVQLLVTGLGRGCQSSDVVDNLVGLAVGLVIGTVVGWLRGRPPEA
jgi:VanZ like family